ncbi:uncharacterized protein G2W53_036916 [Senna tora]|uniref:Uncharacterized protein n=1 Tax=Senna tora TaxID=362788 RepID=A0A834STG5_9FABA|nr:uncharacterized protein G2W53_036916 [Senna tora]
MDYGFFKFWGNGNALKVELWAIASGIRFAISLGCLPFGISLLLSCLIPLEKEINALIN